MKPKADLKDQLRRHFRAQAADHLSQEPELSRQVSRAVVGYIRSSAHAQNPESMTTRLPSLVLGCFQALPGEPDLNSIFSELKADGFDLAFPSVHGDDLRFYKPESENDWQEGPWGIREPSIERAEQVEIEALKTVLVPGLAFDKRGARLGRGKGFYDRALQNYKGTKIGVTFAYALAEDELPSETHDVRMNMIITEAGVLSTARERVL